jgi:hypothetical protein
MADPGFWAGRLAPKCRVRGEHGLLCVHDRLRSDHASASGLLRGPGPHLRGASDPWVTTPQWNSASGPSWRGGDQRFASSRLPGACRMAVSSRLMLAWPRPVTVSRRSTGMPRARLAASSRTPLTAGAGQFSGLQCGDR